eukprot:TRINITY_DN2179_c0_g1_i2.p1 TRINITY_DN2179_c0_g1~~TRINITY_DN2179_c0_g1_i2.p1  ORF type:complete len:228 (+),score=63.29 TRINITY_DN2179_c0_g1_i2:785-1468(+)
MCDAARFSLKYSRWLKIKLDNDVEKTAKILARLLTVCQEHCGDEFQWSVDANTAWPSATFTQMLHVLEPYQKYIYMIEQPFPLGFPDIYDETELAKWVALKDECAKRGMLVFADESVCNHNDVLSLLNYVHGVNVKLEKAGGMRNALQTVLAARQHNIKVWLGVMVGSVLNSNAAAQLLEFCVGCDVDGALLVTEESSLFRGGFTWEAQGVMLPVDGAGLCVTPVPT